MSETEQIDLLIDAMARLRSKVQQTLLGNYNARLRALDREHGELDGLLPSPYLDQFEDYYRRKLALGQLSIEQIFAKIDASVHKRVGPVIRKHIKAHILVNPPTKEEIELAVADEVEREALERESRIQDALDALLEVRAAQKQAKAEITRGKRVATIVSATTLTEARQLREPYVIRLSDRFVLFLDSRGIGHKRDRKAGRFTSLDKNDREAVENTRRREA